MFYFAYGSNLCLARLRARGTAARFQRIGAIKGYRLRFNKHGRDGSAKANVEPGLGIDCVWGALFSIPEDRIECLRQAEGFPVHYTEARVMVSGNGEAMSAMTYVACVEQTEEGLLPFDWYLDHIVKGARAFGLPADYVHKLRLVQATPDPDPERAGLERAHWNHGSNDGQ